MHLLVCKVPQDPLLLFKGKVLKATGASKVCHAMQRKGEKAGPPSGFRK